MTNQSQTIEEQQGVLKRYEQEYPAAARLNRYFDLAQALKTTATESEAGVIKLLETYIQLSKQALDKNDIDHFAQSFENVIRYAVELNLPAHDKRVESKNQKERSNARLLKYARLKKLAIKRYKSGNWNNPSRASVDLAKELGASQRTIAGWLQEYVKNKP